MKKSWLYMMIILLTTSVTFAYNEYVGDYTIERDTAIEEDAERLPRGLQEGLFAEPTVDMEVIMFPRPEAGHGYGSFGGYKMVEAVRYEYPDGRIMIKDITDGEVLFEKE